MIHRNTENPFDGSYVPDANLGVGLPLESGARVGGPSFDEYPLHRIEWRLSILTKNIMQGVDHRAVQIPPQAVLVVLGKRPWRLGLAHDVLQHAVRQPDPVDSRGCGEIQADTKVDHRAHDGGMGDLRSSSSAGGQLAREIEAPLWIGLPEINPAPRQSYSLELWMNGSPRSTRSATDRSQP